MAAMLESLRSLAPVKEVTKACAWVPFTGMLNSFPAKTLLVPSNPPETVQTDSIGF